MKWAGGWVSEWAMAHAPHACVLCLAGSARLVLRACACRRGRAGQRLMHPATALACRRRGWQAPALLRALATLATLLLLSHWTFWAAAHGAGVTAASIVSVRDGLAAAAQLLPHALRF